MIDAASKEAEVVKEKKLLEVKEKFLNKKAELEKEVQQRNSRIQQSENKLKQREISLNQRQEDLGRRKQEVEQYQQRIDNEKKLLAVKQQELEKMQKQEQAKLEELSGLSAEEAKSRLVESLKDQARLDAASYINESHIQNLLVALAPLEDFCIRIDDLIDQLSRLTIIHLILSRYSYREVGIIYM